MNIHTHVQYNTFTTTPISSQSVAVALFSIEFITKNILWLHCIIQKQAWGNMTRSFLTKNSTLFDVDERHLAHLDADCSLLLSSAPRSTFVCWCHRNTNNRWHWRIWYGRSCRQRMHKCIWPTYRRIDRHCYKRSYADVIDNGVWYAVLQQRVLYFFKITLYITIEFSL